MFHFLARYLYFILAFPFLVISMQFSTEILLWSHFFSLIWEIIGGVLMYNVLFNEITQIKPYTL